MKDRKTAVEKMQLKFNKMIMDEAMEKLKKENDKIDIIDFFDPWNIDHLVAWRQMESCKWPEGFLPKNIKFSEGWTMRIRTKLADCWIDYMIGL
jgi:hypothetical protein